MLYRGEATSTSVKQSGCWRANRLVKLIKDVQSLLENLQSRIFLLKSSYDDRPVEQDHHRSRPSLIFKNRHWPATQAEPIIVHPKNPNRFYLTLAMWAATADAIGKLSLAKF